MRRLLAAAVFGLAAAASAPAASAPAEVAMPGQFYAPRRLDVLVGTTVVWRNNDSRVHTVTADDRSFDSGDIPSGTAFERRFDELGSFRFHCRIHRFMRGVVNVYRVALLGPARPVTSGREATLRGLGASPGQRVVLERLAPDAAPVGVGTVTADADGAFTFTFAPDRSATYQARVGSVTSPPATVFVAPRVTLTKTASGRRVLLNVSASPGLPGARVELQVYSRERYAWDRSRAARLGPGSTASFAVAPGGRTYVRAVVRAAAGFADGTSPTVVVG
jgi:plastocyanin